MSTAADTGAGILSVRDLSLRYGGIIGISGLSLDVPAGGVVALLGPNGAGKSSALKAICGEGSTRGRVLFEGRDVSRWSPDRRARAGLVQVPQEGGLFKEMSVEENLRLGAWGRSRTERDEAHARVVEIFPRLGERRRVAAGVLSGGEQQMVALGRALMGSPRMLLLDEPTIGLAPAAVTEVFRQIETVAALGLSLVIVDQNAMQALRLATHVCIVNRGRVVFAATKEEALEQLNIVDAHLGLVRGGPLGGDGEPELPIVEAEGSVVSRLFRRLGAARP
jgi:branched-chain amino acid transport system ATP-binding protein